MLRALSGPRPLSLHNGCRIQLPALYKRCTCGRFCCEDLDLVLKLGLVSVPGQFSCPQQLQIRSLPAVGPLFPAVVALLPAAGPLRPAVVALFRSSLFPPRTAVTSLTSTCLLVSSLLPAATVRHVHNIACSCYSCAVLMALHEPLAMALHGSLASLHGSPCFSTSCPRADPRVFPSHATSCAARGLLVFSTTHLLRALLVEVVQS